MSEYKTKEESDHAKSFWFLPYGNWDKESCPWTSLLFEALLYQISAVKIQCIVFPTEMVAISYQIVLLCHKPIGELTRLFKLFTSTDELTSAQGLAAHLLLPLTRTLPANQLCANRSVYCKVPILIFKFVRCPNLHENSQALVIYPLSQNIVHKIANGSLFECYLRVLLEIWYAL